MPKLVSEITEGVAFSRSSEEGQVADSQPRVFRVVLSEPGELIDIQQVCGVKIGDELRPGAKIYCTSFDARFEGSSRVVLVCTFQFRTTPGGGGSGGSDPKSMSPPTRPAIYTTSTSLVESPRSVWWLRTNAQGGWVQKPDPAVNPVGDMYDGVTALEPVVNISITQYDQIDPTKNLEYAGYVNEEQITLGNLQMRPGTVLFRGVSYQPVVESWGGVTFRGWTATYEFAYKRNAVRVRIGAQDVDADIGWDIAVPLTGWNVKAFAPNQAAADEDVFGQPLRHGDEDDQQFAGRIKENPLSLPAGVAAGDRVRAMVKVHAYKGGGATQAPSASPVALTQQGRPLKTHNANGVLINAPLVFAYRVQPMINLTQELGLRLQ